jgi:4-hydroxyphenylpyruvate dioxygenase-like putative hemolysin
MTDAQPVVNFTIPKLDARIASLARHAEAVDHVAIAVRDLEAGIAWFRDILGFELVERRRTEGRRSGMVSAVLRLGPLTFVLMEGTTPESQICRFIEHYGPGIQHIAIRVSGLRPVVDSLREAGLEFSTDIISPGPYNQVFTKRDPNTGLMIELVEWRGEHEFVDEGVKQLFEQLEASDAF